MSMYVPEGASLPSGIEVDETSAYFGLTASSDLLLSLNSMNRTDAIGSVLERISDLLLTGAFDLDSASERLKVESGEIYYILSGPLDLLGVTEPLREYLGLAEGAGAPPDDISSEALADLEALLDPLELLRIYAVGDIVGGAEELEKYVVHLESMLAAPAANVDDLVAIHRQMKEILSETMQMSMPQPIETLSKREVPTPLPAPASTRPAVEEPQTYSPTLQQGTPAVPTQIPQPLREPAPEPAQHLTQPPSPPSTPAPARGGPAPLIEAQPLDRPVIIERPARPADLDQTKLASIEADALNTENWMMKPEVQDRERADQQRDEETSSIQVEPHHPPLPAQPTQAPALPKPVRPVKGILDHVESTNGIARTFPQGQLCPGCGVSQSTSWRYCALCGRTA